MNLFFISMLVIVSGGVFTLIFRRQFILMKIIGVFMISAGCFLGLIDAFSKLFNPGQYSFSFNYLNTLALSFKIESWERIYLEMTGLEMKL